MSDEKKYREQFGRGYMAEQLGCARKDVSLGENPGYVLGAMEAMGEGLDDEWSLGCSRG